MTSAIEGQHGVQDQASEVAGAGAAELARALAPGVVLLREGRPAAADPRALELLGLADAAELGRDGLPWESAMDAADGGPALVTLRRDGGPLLAEARRLSDSEGDGTPTVLLLSDPGTAAGLAADHERATHLRSLIQISPAVAHDLRAPINAMVFNLEILKETIAAGKGAEPAGRERQLRYVNVLRDELARLHRELEIFLSQTSGRGDRGEEVDLGEAARELVALLVPMGRKIQVQVEDQVRPAAEAPDRPVRIAANRWQLRQALLQVGLAALARIGHPGKLTARVEASDGRARLTLAGPAGPAGETAPPASFDFSLGEPASLHVARALLAAQGGDVRPVSTGGEAGFEVEWPVPAV